MSDQKTPDPDIEESNAPENTNQAPAGEESTAEISIELLQKQLEDARTVAEEQKNLALRAVADGQNAQRRAEKKCLMRVNLHWSGLLPICCRLWIVWSAVLKQ